MTPEGFEALVEPHRRELTAYCYRMLGSFADAEDQVQETLLRAWSRIDGFEGRASMRTWLYRIATNACMDALRARPKRGIPAETGVTIDPHAKLPAVDPELTWIEPAAASWIDATPAGPDAQVAARESIQLAFIVALQHLPASQRAAIILRDVVGWSAREVAELLDATVPSVNSTLQRARETLDARRKRAPVRLDDSQREALLARYMRVWETGDADALAALLHEDVVASMPPIPGVVIGRDALLAFIRGRMGAPGVQRVVPASGADDIALAFYRRDLGTDQYQAYALQIVTLEGPLVREIHAFIDAGLFPRFGLSPIHR